MTDEYKHAAHQLRAEIFKALELVIEGEWVRCDECLEIATMLCEHIERQAKNA